MGFRGGWGYSLKAVVFLVCIQLTMKLNILNLMTICFFFNNFEKLSMQYIDFFQRQKLGKIRFLFYFRSKHTCTLWVHVEAVLTSTNSVCSESKLRNLGIPLHTPRGYTSHGHAFLMLLPITIPGTCLQLTSCFYDSLNRVH